MGNKVIKICYTPWHNASRDERELSACRELGLEPIVVTEGKDHDWFTEDTVSGFRVLRFSTRPLGKIARFRINREACIFTWAWCVRKLKPKIISGHNIRGLFIGWVSTIGMPKAQKPRLVYDSHEFELGRNTPRTKLNLFFLKYLERFLINRCDFSIMVNDAIADEVQKIHKLKKRPIVVRSTPNRWTIDPQECNRIRTMFNNSMKDPREMLLMYHGGVTEDRGIEMLLQVTERNPHVCSVILGYGDESYLAELKTMAYNLNVSDRVLFHPAVPIEELWKYVGAADVGMITIPAAAKSYYYMLPNKFFENIQSETPVITSDFPAIAPIVKKYGIGLTCDPTDIEQVNACIEKMRTDKKFYAQCKKNQKNAKNDLCWEKEKRTLQAAYREIIK